MPLEPFDITSCPLFSVAQWTNHQTFKNKPRRAGVKHQRTSDTSTTTVVPSSLAAGPVNVGGGGVIQQRRGPMSQGIVLEHVLRYSEFKSFRSGLVSFSGVAVPAGKAFAWFYRFSSSTGLNLNLAYARCRGSIKWHMLMSAWKCSNWRFILAGINNPPRAHVSAMMSYDWSDVYSSSNSSR